jgi:glutathione S-transferase
MIELFQFSWSPYCIVARRILEFSGRPFKTTNIPNGERALIWKLTQGAYYAVPVIRDGKQVIYEINDDTQVIAKYLDAKYELGLFPAKLEGVQSLLWRFIENNVEGTGFKLNDIYWKEFVPANDHLRFLRHKERKFGRGCIDQWRRLKPSLLEQLEADLLPFEEMLTYKPFLLDTRPRFVDFDLYGMLGNFLFSGHYKIPQSRPRLRKWYGRMNKITLSNLNQPK